MSASDELIQEGFPEEANSTQRTEIMQEWATQISRKGVVQREKWVQRPWGRNLPCSFSRPEGTLPLILTSSFQLSQTSHSSSCLLSSRGIEGEGPLHSGTLTHTVTLPCSLSPTGPQHGILLGQCLKHLLEAEPWRHCRLGSHVQLLPVPRPHSPHPQRPCHTLDQDLGLDTQPGILVPFPTGNMTSDKSFSLSETQLYTDIKLLPCWSQRLSERPNEIICIKYFINCFTNAEITFTLKMKGWSQALNPFLPIHDYFPEEEQKRWLSRE